jgi:xylan 1,4-beta-xylosidase
MGCRVLGKRKSFSQFPRKIHAFRIFAASIALLLSAISHAVPQEDSQEVHIQVAYDKTDGAMPHVWSFFGYDEPNYTYAANGKKLLQELTALSRRPVYVRVHNLLTSGDGASSLKWGSTNAYTQDAEGKPVYDWKIVDRIFDTFKGTGVRPLIATIFRTTPSAAFTQDGPIRQRTIRSGRS